ncbi:MAG: hypothetical protein ACP5O6_09415 [Candidatus Baltobacteraceae bacterium]
MARPFVAILVGVTLLGALTHAVRANCAIGGARRYRDISGISVRRTGLTDIGDPKYRFSVDKNGFVAFDGAEKTPIVGNYDGRDGRQLLLRLVAILRNRSFFEMSLRTSRKIYIDGPEDSISVLRCGVVTTISTVGSRSVAFEAALHGERMRRFFALLRALEAPIFAWPWTQERRLSPERKNPA